MPIKTRPSQPWTEPFFEELALRHRERFAECIFVDLANEPVLLSYAAEAARLLDDHQFALRILERLLLHPLPVVREGAVYGIGGHLVTNEAKELLMRHRGSEHSPAVLAAIDEALTT